MRENVRSMGPGAFRACPVDPFKPPILREVKHASPTTCGPRFGRSSRWAHAIFGRYGQSPVALTRGWPTLCHRGHPGQPTEFRASPESWDPGDIDYVVSGQNHLGCSDVGSGRYRGSTRRAFARGIPLVMVLWGLYGGSVAVKGKVSKLTYDFPLARSRALCGGVHSRLTRDAVRTLRDASLGTDLQEW